MSKGGGKFPDFKQYCEAACVKAWGTPTKRTKSELLWNAGDGYGARRYDLKKHVWFDRGADRGGSTLQLVDYVKGRPKRELKGKVFFEVWREAFELGFVPIPPPEKSDSFPPIRATFAYTDENGAPLYEVVRFESSDPNQRFRQRQDDGKGGWIWSIKGVRRVLFRLPQLIAAVNAGELVLLTEGEKDAETAVKLGYVATTAPGGINKWQASYDEVLRNADIIVVSDRDPQLKDPKTGKLQFHPDGRPIFPGQDHAAKVAKRLSRIAKRVRVVMFDVKDLSEWVEAGGTRDELDALIAAAPEQTKPAATEEDKGEDKPADTAPIDDDAELERLARMGPLDYERSRRAASEMLGITRLSLLDNLVTAKRDELGLIIEKLAPPLYEHWTVEAANAPVDGGILLRALKEIIRRHVFLSDDQATAAALWVVFSWLHDRMTHSPILFVTSPEKDSGKSTLCGVLNFLTCRGFQCVGVTGPTLFRSITKWLPTLIVDEADKAFVKNDDLRDVINAGWTRGQCVPRCDPVTHEVIPFGAFAPKVIAMKGRKVEDTTLSRTIIITLKRKRPNDPNEQVVDFDHLDNETFARLRTQLMRWAADNIEDVVKATPETPAGFYNRRRANWKPLLAIAEACGGEWKVAAWKAAKAIEAVADTFDTSINLQLLQTIKAAFEARIEVAWRTEQGLKATDELDAMLRQQLAQAIKAVFKAPKTAKRDSGRIKSEDLLDELVADATAPWATYNKGKPISQRQVAGLLRDYDIKPRTIRFDDGTTAKGYQLEWFIDAFERFCKSPEESAQAAAPYSGSVTASQVLSANDLAHSASVTNPIDVTDKKDDNSLKTNDCYAVTDPQYPPRPSAVCAAHFQSSPLDYYGPKVKVPDLGPDPLDPHGNPLVGNVTSDHGAAPQPEQPEAAEAAGMVHAEGTVASVPFMLTRAIKAELRARGFDPEHIAELTPEEAHRILAPHPGALHSGLSDHELDDVGRKYADYAADHRDDTGKINQAAADAWLRGYLRQRVLPEYLEVEFQRVMDAVFGAPSQGA